MRAIAFVFLFACSPTIPAPVAPLGHDDGADHGVAATTPSSGREIPRPILLSSRSSAERCRIAIAEGARLAMSTDQTRIAIQHRDELEIWNPRTCDATTHSVPELVGTAFIGASHELLVIQRGDSVQLSRIARDGTIAVPGTIAERPTRWAVSPDGRLAALGVTDETRSSLAIWDLRNSEQPIVAVQLPVVEREIDGLAFSADGKTAVVTVPVFASRRDDLQPRYHLAIAYDTRTWKSKRKVVVSQLAAPESLRIERDAIIVDGRAF